MLGPVLGTAAALLALAAGPARADCFDWTAPAAVIREGTLQGLPPGPVAWRTGTSSMGFGHAATAVALRWTQPDRSTVEQVIFTEIQDGTPRLLVDAGRLQLRVAYCEPRRGCRSVSLPYRWDPAAGRFAGANRAARETLAAVSCTPTHQD